MTRAYSPRPATVDLIRRISALDGIERVHSIAPSRGTHPRPAGLRVYLSPRMAPGHVGPKVYADFTLSEARQWLADEEAAR